MRVQIKSWSDPDRRSWNPADTPQQQRWQYLEAYRDSTHGATLTQLSPRLKGGKKKQVQRIHKQDRNKPNRKVWPSITASGSSIAVWRCTRSTSADRCSSTLKPTVRPGKGTLGEWTKRGVQWSLKTGWKKKPQEDSGSVCDQREDDVSEGFRACYSCVYDEKRGTKRTRCQTWRTSIL